MQTRILAIALTSLGLAASNAPAQEGMPVLKQVIPAGSWPAARKTIALQGDWMAISIPGTFVPTTVTNRIEIWKRVAGSWMLHTTLTDPVWEGQAEYGLCATSLKFDSTGTLLIAGDPRFSTAFLQMQSDCGTPATSCTVSCGERVRIFRRVGDVWALDTGGDLQSSLSLPSGVGSQVWCRGFGWEVDIEGDLAYVASPFRSSNDTLNPDGVGYCTIFVRRETGWEPTGESTGYTASPCGTLFSRAGQGLLLRRPPLAPGWVSTQNANSAGCSVNTAYVWTGDLNPLGVPLESTSWVTYTATVDPRPIRLIQDQNRIISVNGKGVALRVLAIGSDGSFIDNGTDLFAPSGTPAALRWGVHSAAANGRLVTCSDDNRIFVYDWVASSATAGSYALRGQMAGPTSDPIRAPNVVLSTSNEFNGRSLAMSGGTLAVQAQSGAILVYEFFADCNSNEVSDQSEIAANPLLDCDSTGSLDECEPLPVPPPVPTRSTWKAPFGGSFQDVANWCRQAPVNTTAIEFGIPFNYGVNLTQTREVKNITASSGFPTLNFSSATQILRSSTAQAVPLSERYLRVGTQVGTPASLGVVGGTVNTAFGEVGVGGGTEGTLFVGPGGKVISTSELCVGCEGDGTLLLQNGGQAVSQKAIIGKTATSSGLATVESTSATNPSRWSSTLGIDVKNGALAVNTNGIIDSPALGVILYAGGSLTGNGTIIGPVTNFGSAAGFCGPPALLGEPIVHRYGGLMPGGGYPAGSQGYGDYGTIGTLTINGLYQQIAANPDLGTNSGSLLIEIAKRDNNIAHDKIVVNGPATLGGGLFVTLATDPAKDQIDFTGLPVFTASSIDPDRPNFDIAFMPALPNGRFVKVDAPSSLQGGGGAITISTSDLASLLGFGGGSNTTFDLEPLAAAVGDLDGVNGNDVAVTLKGTGTSGASANGTLLLLFNDGNGGLQNVVQLPNQLGREPVDIVAAPLRPGRKVPDLAVVNRASDTLQVLYNDGIGNFTTGQLVSTGPGSAPSSIDAVPIFAEDPTLAGIFDLVITNSGLGSLSVFFNPGDGAPIPLLVLPAGTSPTAVRGVDIDNNRFFDLVAANQQDGLVSVFMRRASDPKDPSVSFSDALNLGVGEDPVDLVTGDLDGDGRTDITTVNKLSNSVSVLLNRTTVTGEATFAPAVTLPTGGEPQSIVLGDFDQD
ncbi:MAG: hypothetical protein RL580_1616, partial [Pseudomonadota bacterium]